jgi:hypothetical protein
MPTPVRECIATGRLGSGLGRRESEARLGDGRSVAAVRTRRRRRRRRRRERTRHCVCQQDIDTVGSDCRDLQPVIQGRGLSRLRVAIICDHKVVAGVVGLLQFEVFVAVKLLQPRAT